jgi:hypothetical protein
MFQVIQNIPVLNFDYQLNKISFFYQINFSQKTKKQLVLYCRVSNWSIELKTMSIELNQDESIFFRPVWYPAWLGHFGKC